MTTPNQPGSNPPPNPNRPPPPGNYETNRDAARRAARSSQPRTRQGGSKFGTMAVIAVLAVAGVLAYKHFSSGQSPPGQSPSGRDIRSVVKAFTDDWNKADVTAIKSLWCSGNAPDATILRKEIDWFGHIETSVSDIGGSGDKASADIKATFSGPGGTGGSMDTWYFLNEGGSWKPCDTAFIWDNAHGH
jgi:hypothetical protein